MFQAPPTPMRGQKGAETETAPRETSQAVSKAVGTGQDMPKLMISPCVHFDPLESGHAPV